MLSFVACLSSQLNGRQNDFAQKALELKNGFDIVGSRKACGCAPTAAAAVAADLS